MPEADVPVIAMSLMSTLDPKVGHPNFAGRKSDSFAPARHSAAASTSGRGPQRRPFDLLHRGKEQEAAWTVYRSISDRILLEDPYA